MSRVIRAFTQESPSSVGDELILSESESNHLFRVLRLKAGDTLEVLDGRGGRYPSECLDAGSDKVVVRILEKYQVPTTAPVIRMAIAMGKGNKLDDLIRPITELGVGVITPLLTERTEGTISSSRLEDKKKRWQKITREACKQSGNLWVPKLDNPIRFPNLVSEVQKNEDCWIGALSSGESFLAPQRHSEYISIFIGPEGGWSPEEEGIAKQSGFNFFTLGSHVLRLETAVVSALAVARQSLLC